MIADMHNRIEVSILHGNMYGGIKCLGAATAATKKLMGGPRQNGKKVLSNIRPT